MDEASLRRYQNVSGPFGEELRRSIITEADGSSHYLLTPEGRCPFLREDGLCRQILELGEDALCEICANHPRFFQRFGDLEEQGVGLACEEAARLLFTEPGPLTLLETGTGEAADFAEEALYRLLLDWRAECFAAAADDALSIHERLGAVLSLGRQADRALWGEPWDATPPEVLPGHALLWLDRLTELEPIDDEWTAALEDALAAAEYPELLEDFAAQGGGRQYDRLLSYLLFRYALEAVWDQNPKEWADFCVFCVLTVELLDFGRWLRNAQSFSSEDRQDIARIFSKEVEYDPELMDGLCALAEELELFRGEREAP